MSKDSEGINSKNIEKENLDLDTNRPAFITDNRGKIIYVNDALCKKLGFQEDELVGSVLQESSFLTKDSQKKVMYRQIARLIGKEKPFYNLKFKTNTGDVLSLDIETNAFEKNGKNVGEISIVQKVIEPDFNKNIAEEIEGGKK